MSTQPPELYRRFSYPWLANVVRERGLFATIRASVPFFSKLGRLWWWDWKHNVSTRHRVTEGILRVIGPGAAHARSYEPTGTTVLPRLLRELHIRHQDYVFVDLGSGKGQALFLAAQFPFKRIVGVELSRGLYEIGLQNRKTFRSRTQACQNIDVICGDAADFAFPNEPLVVFIFNAFDQLVLSRVLGNLVESIAEHSREVLFIYHNPRHRDVFEASGIFEPVLTGTDERDFRKLGYEVFHAARARQPVLKVQPRTEGGDSLARRDEREYRKVLNE